MLHTYIENDIHRTLGVEKLEEYETFLRLLALRTGQELRIETLAREVGVSEITATRWLSVAEASGIVYFLRPFHENISKILVKSPKIYFVDTGLACYLSGLTSVEQLKTYYNRGALFETFVIVELLKSWVHNGKKPDFFFYRDSKGAEIDLLIRSGLTYHPIEIKASEHPTLSMVKSFDVLTKENVNHGAGSLITLAGPNEVLSKNVTTHCVWDI